MEYINAVTLSHEGIFMKKRKDGRYQSSVIVTDILTNKKRRVYVYGYTENEVQRELERVKRNNGSLNFGDVTFKIWLDEWLKIKKEELAPSTLDNYVLRLNKHVVPQIGELRLKNITPSTIREVLQKVEGDRSKKYIYMLLHSILQQACIDELIDRNPCVAVKTPKYKPKEKQIITSEEFQKLLENSFSEQYRRIFILAYYTGMRRAEICALKWNNVDMANKIINVTSAVKITASGNIIGEPKSDSGIRKILLSQNVISILNQQYLFQKTRYFKHGKKVQDHDFLFTSEIDTFSMITPSGLSHIFDRTKKAAKIKTAITFHSFRHTHTTMLVESGIPIKAIQARLGHSTPSFTLAQYAHNTEKMQQEIVNILDKQSNII